MRLHQWDVLRANKAPFAFGLESRVPFLDRGFLDTCMTVDPAEKMVIAHLIPSAPESSPLPAQALPGRPAFNLSRESAV